VTIGSGPKGSGVRAWSTWASLLLLFAVTGCVEDGRDPPGPDPEPPAGPLVPDGTLEGLDLACGMHLGDTDEFADNPELEPLASGLGLGDTPEPRHLVLGWQSSPSTSITVTWQTDDTSEEEQTRSTRLQIGRQADLSDALEIDPRSGHHGPGVGSAHHLPWHDEYATIHVAEACGLAPATRYHYRVGGVDGAGGEVWSEVRSFRTAPRADTALDEQDFRFAVIGDTRTDWDTWGEVAAAALAEEPLFVVLVGDLVTSGSSQDDWDEWFAAAEDLLATVPVMTAVGNHEYNALHYYAQLSLPGNEQWYAFDVAGMRMALLNDTTSGTLGKGSCSVGRQATFVGRTFGRGEHLWRFAAHHRPHYSSGSHGGSSTCRGAWGPLFDAFGVSLVFSGHDHAYERSVPVHAGDEVAHAENGTTYLVTGGGGAPLYGMDGDWWTAHSARVHHYTLVEIQGRLAQFSARETDGSVFDSLTLDASGVDVEACEQGRPCNPIVVDVFPFVDSRDTADALSYEIDAYACAPDTDESGGEFYYELVLPAPGVLRAEVSDDSGVDVDLHLLEDLGGDSCLIRDDVSFEQELDAGTWYLVADTWVNGSCELLSGPFELVLEFEETDATAQEPAAAQVGEDGKFLETSSTGDVGP
jgi:acid phosphatase type 7